MSRRSMLGTVGAVAASGMFAGCASLLADEGFDPIDASPAEIMEGYEQGVFTAEDVVGFYLDRIYAYEDDLQAVISINPHAMERAAELDDALESDGMVGPLHGIPVLVKDNINTDDIPTTTGAVALEDSIPPESATIVDNIRDAGGIVIAKANMDEFAFGYDSSSSMGGQVYNPYDLERSAGGSSGGSGAGMAANYAPIGIGTDTGGSVRVPALANNLVGVRPTRQLVSGEGVSPLHSSQDIAGPMTHTVEESALLLDVMASVDPDDPLTLESYENTPHADGNQYTDYLNEDGLEGARIGVYSEWVPDEDDEDEDEDLSDIIEIFEDALTDMAMAGATLVTDLEPPSGGFVSDAYRGDHTHMDWNNYLETIEEFESLDELVATGELESCGMAGTIEDPDSLEELEEDIDFLHPFFEQRQLQHYILRQMHENDLDAIIYPGNWDVPTVDGWGWGPANLHLSPVLDWPSIAMPVGFTDDGAPVGMEFLGPMWSEPELFELTYAYEQVADAREPPEDFDLVEDTGIEWDASTIENWNDERPVYDTVDDCEVDEDAIGTDSDDGPDMSNLP
ncbi:amidase family protein [Halobacteria archaeon AArc-dxtr1]|nr:amidase family protein [Halobacteria archaeon AArc-dxtr1]